MQPRRDPGCTQARPRASRTPCGAPCSLARGRVSIPGAGASLDSRRPSDAGWRLPVTLDPRPLAALASPDELTAALQATVERARSSPLYRERLTGVQLRAAADLRQLPLTTRADLQRAGVDGTSEAALASVCHYVEPSGTTGEPHS